MITYLEGLLQVGPKRLGDGLLALLALGKTIEGPELGALELDDEAVVLLGLHADQRGQLEAGLLVGPDFGDARVHLGLEPEHELALGLPSIVMGGVAEGGSH